MPHHDHDQPATLVTGTTPRGGGRRLRRWAITAAVAVTTALAVLGAPAGPAQAAARPYDGASPVSTGCANTAITARAVDIKDVSNRLIGQLQLRYSTRCRTAWARLFIRTGTPGHSFATIIRDTDDVNDTCIPRAYDTTCKAWYCYTNMVNDDRVTAHAEALGGHLVGARFNVRTPSY